MKKISTIFVFILLALSLFAQETIPFDTTNWNFYGGRTIEMEGQQAYMGNAVLKDVDFLNGTIEVDVYVSGARSFPGILFRMNSSSDFELFYIRPHKLDGTFYDALQYTPVFHSVSCWQLYHGEGYTRPIVMPTKEWVHVKIEVSSDMAIIYIGDNQRPSLMIHNLELPTEKGSIGVYGPANGSAYFANFKYSSTDPVIWPSPEKPVVAGVIDEWTISSPLTGNLVNPNILPDQEDLEWKKVKADPSGLVNLTRELVRNPTQAGWALAKAEIITNEPGIHRYSIGYSDYTTAFLNGKPIFTGSSAFRGRDPLFAGLIGYNDELHLDLKEGKNELTLLVGESMGGWGFMVKEAEAIHADQDLELKWELSYQLDHPESVEYDPKRAVIYASNNLKRPTESVSKISLDGKVIKKDWVSGLMAPTGMVLVNDKLHVVERGAVVIIDPETAVIEKRIPLPGAVFPNDITANEDGSLILISDGGQGAIYSIIDGESAIWHRSPELRQVNGLLIDGQRLLLGISSYPALCEMDMESKEIKQLVQLLPGAVMDGIQKMSNGDVLFSDWTGSLYRYTSEGILSEILNTRNQGITLADFRWIEDERLLLIPTLYDNRIVCWGLE